MLLSADGAQAPRAAFYTAPTPHEDGGGGCAGALRLRARRRGHLRGRNNRCGGNGLKQPGEHEAHGLLASPRLARFGWALARGRHTTRWCDRHAGAGHSARGERRERNSGGSSTGSAAGWDTLCPAGGGDLRRALRATTTRGTGQAGCSTHKSVWRQAHAGHRQARGQQETFSCSRQTGNFALDEGGEHGALGWHLPTAKTTLARTTHDRRRAMALLGDSNTPNQQSASGQGIRQLAALLKRTKHLLGARQPIPTRAKTIASPQDHRSHCTQPDQSHFAAPDYEDSRGRRPDQR